MSLEKLVLLRDSVEALLFMFYLLLFFSLKVRTVFLLLARLLLL